MGLSTLFEKERLRQYESDEKMQQLILTPHVLRKTTRENHSYTMHNVCLKGVVGSLETDSEDHQKQLLHIHGSKFSSEAVAFNI